MWIVGQAHKSNGGRHRHNNPCKKVVE
jgi:ATP-dependent DNA helicase PIF1